MIINKNKMNYKIGIYVRESRDDNEENYETIETQRDLLLDHVKKNDFGEVVRVYIDDNFSGSGFERPGIILLTDDVKNGIITLLVIKDLSRLGRNNAKTLLFLDFLEEYSIRVITFDGKYDSIRDNDTVGIHTWFNEHYLRDLSKKIRSNLRYKIERGEYIGSAPFGYKKSVSDKNKLVIDDNTEAIVKLIFKLYLEGYGYTYIAKILNTRGLPTPSMKNNIKSPAISWNAVSVKRILFNRVYIGDTIQGISEKVSFKSKKTRRLPAESWVTTKKTHAAIIAKEDFEAVSKIRASRVCSNKQHKGIIHLFKGLIYCGNCGKPMYARMRNGKPMGYICSTYFKSGKAACSSHYIKEAYIIDIIKNEAVKILKLEDNKKIISEILAENFQSEIQLKKELEKLEKTLAGKQKQQEIIYLDKLEGKITDQLFSRTNQNIETKIIELKNEIEKIKNKPIGDLYSQALINYDDINISNNLIKYFIEKIIIFDKGENIEGFDLNKSEVELAAFENAIIIYFKT